MRRAPSITITLSLLLFLSTEITAAPLSQEQLYEITSPRADAEVRGSVDIIGSAQLPDFDFYKLQYASSATPGAWIDMGDVQHQQKTDERLGTWHTTSLPDGAYFLRLVVVRTDGNYRESDAVRVNVANAEPAPTPTPEESPTPTPTIVIPTPTTAIVEQPTGVVHATPSASAEPEASPTAAQETENTVSIPSLDTFVSQCLFGAFVAAVLFVFVGVVFLLRRLI